MDPASVTTYDLRSRWSIAIPDTDLCTFLFTSPTAPLSTDPIYFDAEHPDTRQLSFHTYRSLVKRIARGLTDAGLKRGDRVLVFSGNNVYFPSLYLGIIAAGGVFTGANPMYTPRELAFQLQNSGATWMIAGHAGVETAVTAAEAAGVHKSRVYAFDNSLISDGGDFKWDSHDAGLVTKHGIRHWRELVSESDDYVWKRFTTPSEANTTAAINYSSGTTGVPKGVELSHRNFIANTSQVIATDQLSPTIAARSRRWIGMLPMYHAYGQTYYVMVIPALSIPLYIIPKFDFLTFLTYIGKYRITSIAAVPPILTALAKHPVVDKFDLSSVFSIGSGAAPLSSEIETAVEKRMLKHGQTLRIRQGWGMTEATCSVLGFHPDDNDSPDSGSVGELLPNCEARIVGATGTPLAVNTPGELWIKAPNVCKGYYKNPSATAEIFTPSGWMRTGDVAYYDATGKFFIVDRMKELIKVRGNQVAPAELEGVILEHPGVADVAVVGVPIGEDEGPRAYVVRQPGVEVGVEEVERWVRERCVRYKWITGGVVWVDEVPKNPSGKIMRKVVREWARGGKAKL